MSFNLISIEKLVDEGYHNHLEEGKWKLSKGYLILARGKKFNTLYKTDAWLINGDDIAANNEISANLCHKGAWSH